MCLSTFSILVPSLGNQELEALGGMCTNFTLTRTIWLVPVHGGSIRLLGKERERADKDALGLCQKCGYVEPGIHGKSVSCRLSRVGIDTNYR